MALFRRIRNRKPPDGLLEISERVFVFDCSFSTDVLGKDEYSTYMSGIVGQLQEHFPDASFLVYNFRDGDRRSQISDLLSQYDMTVMDYPGQYEGCPLLPLKMVNLFLRSCESWLSFGGQQNMVLMLCERGGWPVLAFMLAGLFLYRNQHHGEQKTLEMVYKRAPQEILHLSCPLNPKPSQLRYLEYISRRNLASDWPPLDTPLALDCIILSVLPLFEGGQGCRPVVRIYGQDSHKNSKLIFSTSRTDVRLYRKGPAILNIFHHVQGDVVVECVHVVGDLVREEMMFRIMFHTAFVGANFLILNRNEVDVLWEARDRIPWNFKAEVLFSDADKLSSISTTEAMPGAGEETDRAFPGEWFEEEKIFSNHPESPQKQQKVAEILLHGTLHVTIYEVDELDLGDSGRKFLSMVRIYLGEARVGETRQVYTEYEDKPNWNQSFRIYCAHMVADVFFAIYKDPLAGPVGGAYISVQELLTGEVDKWLVILGEGNKPVEGQSRIHVKLQFSEARRERIWSRGIKAGRFHGTPRAFFPQRSGCKVSLYQDAHIPDSFIPTIPLSGGRQYKPCRCWEDIFDAISDAKHLIYIAGLSICTEIAMIRDQRRSIAGGDLTVGELLQRKANEGTRVLVIVSNAGKAMENHFRKMGIHFVEANYGYSQTIVIVDNKMPNGDEQTRRIVSFIGGIDQIGGRYDTPNHSLFRTLDTAHHDDFYQPNFTGASVSKGGPREPWHDVHCKLEGQVAWDVLFNFEQRWRSGRARRSKDMDLLINLRDLENYIIPPSRVMFPQDQETWSVQLFRSADLSSTNWFPEHPEDASRAGLISSNNRIIDRSIHDAYINAIRRAKNFIYIENESFLDRDTFNEGSGCLVPQELSAKIVSKIEAGENFRAYVVIPMWPDGIPHSEFVQNKLYWQHRTMQMMYTAIGDALRAKGVIANLKDYLTFFCLGNRECKRNGEYIPEDKPDQGSNYCRAQEARRFMIRVHSKMMIVDDEYIIIGSAKINPQSMDGDKDPEIAMGAYQPYYVSKNKKPARGQIHGFRLALWYEHLGMLYDCFLSPETLICIRKLNNMSEKNWELYSSGEPARDLPGHLLSYPIQVSSLGLVTELPGVECFPDTNAHVLGDISMNIIDFL